MASAAGSGSGGGGGAPDPLHPPPSAFRHVVTAFLEHGPNLALVTRSSKVGTYAGSVGAISGYLEPEDAFSPPARALAEAREEVGLDPCSLTLRTAGRPLAVDDGPGRRFVVHPVRFTVSGAAPPPLRTNWEAAAAAWVPAADLLAGRLARPPVPRLADAYRRVTPPPAVDAGVAALLSDRTHGAAQLARWALRSLADGARQQAGAGVPFTPDHAADLAWPLAAARPAMAPIGAGLAAALLRGRGSWDGLAAAADAEADAAGGRAAALATTAGQALAAAVRAAPPGRTALVTHSFSSAVLDALVAAGTALGPDLAVVVCEARPLCEGARLVGALAERLPHASLTLITDAQAAWHVRQAAAAVVVGADAVLTGGPGAVVNKVGTWALAAAAADAGVPAFAVAGGAKLAGVASLPALACGCVASSSGGGAVEEPDPVAELAPGLLAASGVSLPPSACLRNVYFEATPLSYFTQQGGGVVVEGEVLATADAVRAAGDGAADRAVRAFGLDWLQSYV